MEALVDALEQLLARLELAQIAGDGERLRAFRRLGRESAGKAGNP